jgi:hypothetical protein
MGRLCRRQTVQPGLPYVQPKGRQLLIPGSVRPNGPVCFTFILPMNTNQRPNKLARAGRVSEASR